MEFDLKWWRGCVKRRILFTPLFFKIITIDFYFRVFCCTIDRRTHTQFLWFNLTLESTPLKCYVLYQNDLLCELLIGHMNTAALNSRDDGPWTSNDDNWLRFPCYLVIRFYLDWIEFDKFNLASIITDSSVGHPKIFCSVLD